MTMNVGIESNDSTACGKVMGNELGDGRRYKSILFSKLTYKDGVIAAEMR